MCDCIQIFNEANLQNNTRLVTTIPWNKDDPVYILLSVEKIDPKNRIKPKHIIGAFCPFCGEEIHKKQVSAQNSIDIKMEKS